MTILNACALGEVAYVGVDTLAGSPGEIRRVGKMFPLVHHGAVVAGRGNWMDIAAVAAKLNLLCATFDEMCERAPSLMLETMEASRNLHIAAGWDPDAQLYGCNVMHLHVLGWSDARGRVEGRAFLHRLGVEGFGEEAIADGMTAAPWDPVWGPVPEIQGVPDLCSVANAQVALCRRDFPATPIGGELIVAEIRKSSMRIWKACDLP